jgi:hypothetical protein
MKMTVHFRCDIFAAMIAEVGLAIGAFHMVAAVLFDRG